MNVEMRSLTFRQSFFWVFVYFSKLIANAFQLGGKSNNSRFDLEKILNIYCMSTKFLISR